MKKFLVLVAALVMVFSIMPASAAEMTEAQKNIALINQERVDAGLPVLKETKDLDDAASRRAQECETKFSHTRPD